MVVDPKLAFGLIVGLGSVFRGVISFINKKKETPDLKWDWVVFASEAIPSFAVGFLAGAIYEQPLTALSAITAFFFGAGFTSLVSKAATGARNRKS